MSFLVSPDLLDAYIDGVLVLMGCAYIDVVIVLILRLPR